LETQIYFEEKNYEKAYNSIIYFLDHYKKSPYLPQIYKFYCKVIYQFLENFYRRGEIEKILNIEKKEKQRLRIASCGDIFYWLGDFYLNYNFYTLASYYFIEAQENNLKSKLRAKSFLKITFLAWETGEKNIFYELFEFLEKKYGKLLKNEPIYLYVKAIFEVNKNFKKAEKILYAALRSNLSDTYKSILLRIFRNKALELNKIEKAIKYTKNKYFNPEPEDYILLLTKTFSKNKELFEIILESAKRKYPDNLEIKWLEAYYLEKKGDIRNADKLWEEMSEGNYYANELAKSYKKMKEFIQKSQKLVF